MIFKYMGLEALILGGFLLSFFVAPVGGVIGYLPPILYAAFMFFPTLYMLVRFILEVIKRQAENESLDAAVKKLEATNIIKPVGKDDQSTKTAPSSNSTIPMPVEFIFGSDS
jgi:hypothetical protein